MNQLMLCLLAAMLFVMSNTATPIAMAETAQSGQPTAALLDDHEDDEDEHEDEADEEEDDVLDFEMKTLDGKKIHLGEKYDDKVILMVNVASRCGYTPQYEGLQKLHEKYSKKGLVILGFPCNQFGGQEPGSADQIAEFCQENYGVTFQMFEKIDVNGDEASPLYKYLTNKKKTPKSQGPIKWNFEKFLIDHEEQVVGHYRSKVKPKDLEETIIKLLKKRAEEEEEEEDDDDDDDDEED